MSMSKTAGEPSRTPEEEAAHKARVKRVVRFVGTSFGLAIFMNTSCGPVIADLVTAMADNDTTTAAKMMATMGTTGAVLEFCAGPAVGQFSDAYGRKPFCVAAMGTAGLLNLLVWQNPTSQSVLFFRNAATQLCMTTFVTSVRASLADELTGRDLGSANAGVGMFAGLAIVTGPALGALIAQRIGVSRVFLMSGLVGVANCLRMALLMTETVTKEKRKEVDVMALNPLSFMRLFTNGKEVAMMGLSLLTQCIGEPRFIFPFVAITWSLRYNYGAAQRGRFLAWFGVMMIGGSVFAKKRIKKIGNKAHVTESNLTNLIAFLLWGFKPDWLGTYAGLVALAFGMRKRDGLESLLIGKGDELGWGKGETTAYMANLKSASAMFAPTLMGQTFQYMTTGGRDYYGSPMLAAAFVTMLSEVAFMTVKSDLPD